jgi:hypothetical protein
MKLGYLYYLSGILENSKLVLLSLGWLSLGLCFLYLFRIMDSNTDYDAPIKPYKPALITLMIPVSIFLFSAFIPSKKDFLIIVTANYIDENVLRNDKVGDYVIEKLSLINQKIDSFLSVDEVKK